MNLRGSAWACLTALILASSGLTRLLGQQLESSPGDSDLEPPPWEKGYVQLGGFVTFFNSDLTFGASKVGNRSINAEDRLGLDSTLTVLRAEAIYRPGETRRNQLELTYGGYHREGDSTLTRDLTVGGITYSPGVHISTTFNFDLIRGSYSYAFVQNDWARIAFGLGVYAVPLKYGLTIHTTGGQSVVEEGGDVTVPLPAVEFRAEFKLYEKLFLKVYADGMYLEISDFKGSLFDASFDVEYRAWKHFGFGLGYNFVAAEVQGKSDSGYPGVNFTGDVYMRFSGLLLYGKFTF